jgi:hypothetical protein
LHYRSNATTLNNDSAHVKLYGNIFVAETKFKGHSGRAIQYNYVIASGGTIFAYRSVMTAFKVVVGLFTLVLNLVNVCVGPESDDKESGSTL